MRINGQFNVEEPCGIIDKKIHSAINPSKERMRLYNTFLYNNNQLTLCKLK